MIEVDSPAPDFHLTAVVTKREISLETCDMAPLLLTFVSYQTHQIARELALSIRPDYPRLDQFVLANIIDLKIVPRLLRSTVETILQKAYEEGQQDVPPGFDPADHLILLPDWDGRVFQSFGFQDTSQQIGLVLIDQKRRVAGTYQGESPQDGARQLIEKVMNGG